MTLSSNNSGYMSRNYRVVGYEKRSLAMRLMETHMDMPMEEIFFIMWRKHRRLHPMIKALGLEITTCRNWMKQLGIYICIGCSFKTGNLFTHTLECPGCGRWFCDSCIDQEYLSHLVSDIAGNGPYERDSGTV